MPIWFNLFKPRRHIDDSIYQIIRVLVAFLNGIQFYRR